MARVRGRFESDAQGRPHTLRGTIEDISERKLVEREVRETTGLLELFIQDAPTGLAMFDREMRYISASRRWIEDQGVKEWNVVGQSHYELAIRFPMGGKRNIAEPWMAKPYRSTKTATRERTGVNGGCGGWCDRGGAATGRLAELSCFQRI